MRLVALPLLAALAVGVCGCGGSPDTSTRAGAASGGSTGDAGSGSAGSSAPQFVAQADALCARINHEIIAIKVKSATAAEVIRAVPLILSIERRGTVTLEGLHAPGSLAGDWQRMLGYRKTLLGELGQLLEVAKKNDGKSVKPLAASKKRTHAALTKVAGSDGFKACAKVGRVG